MYRIPKADRIRLFKYITNVDITFNPWDPQSVSTKELWRVLTSKKCKASNPKAIIKANMPSNVTSATTSVKFVDGTTLILNDCSKMSLLELMSHINMGAAKIDNEWQFEERELGGEENAS